MTFDEYSKIREGILAPVQIRVIENTKTHSSYGPYARRGGAVCLGIVDFALKTNPGDSKK